MRALKLDPGDAQALLMMAILDIVAANYSSVDDRVGRLVAAEAAARKALSLAPERAMAHFSMGLVLGATNRAAEGIAAFERALALDRNLASAHAHIGRLKIYVGRAEETENHVREALRLSPRDFALSYWLSFVGFAAFCLGRYDEAAASFQRSIDANRNWPMSHFQLAATLAALGTNGGGANGREGRPCPQSRLLYRAFASCSRPRRQPLPSRPRTRP